MAYNTEEEIKLQYAKEAANYREEALIVNYEFDYCWEFIKKKLRKIFKNNQYPLKVLDIGAGTGMLTEHLLEEYPNAHVTMLDFSKEMLAKGKAYFDENGINNDNIKQVCSNFITEPFPNESYNLIISSYAIHHVRTVKDLKRLYEKIGNALRNELGVFFCFDYYLADTYEERKKQTESLKNQLIKYFSKDEVKQWIDLIRLEDTPATIYQTYEALSETKSSRLLGYKGDLSVVYGAIKGKQNQDFFIKTGLDSMVRKYQNEYKNGNFICEIGSYPPLLEDTINEETKTSLSSN